MTRRPFVLSLLLFIFGLFCLAQSRPNLPSIKFVKEAQAQLARCDGNVGGLTGPVTASTISGCPAASAGCTQATNFIARETGPTNNGLITTMICNMVLHATWNFVDAFWFYAATADTLLHAQANALLNLITGSYGSGTANGGFTFTAGAGFTGDGHTAVIDTGFNPVTDGTNFKLNTATHGACNNTSRTTSQPNEMEGATDGTNFTVSVALNAGLAEESTNTTSVFGGAFANSNAQGLYVISRTASNNVFVRKNRAALGAGSDSDTGSAIANLNFYTLAFNNNGGTAGWTTDQISAVFYAGFTTTAQMDSFASDLGTALNSAGVGGC